MKKLLIILLILPNLLFADHNFTDFDKYENQLIEDVKDNNYVKHGVWLEFRSISNPTEWNKVLLIFAYGESGNFDECIRIIKSTYPSYYSSNDVRCQEVQ